MAEQIGIRELLEAGVHFGHQTRRWNPKMRRFIHGERSGIYIIDLLKTQTALASAQEFAADLARRGGTVLFVGTKKQAQESIAEQATRVGMPYVNQRCSGSRSSRPASRPAGRASRPRRSSCFSPAR